ncbi:MAG: hypothetical protein HY359_07635, partial [Candidatus Rokubacteria bacterium]|nr:hypothetical protein [Candidatus Rokubacteria bacterium]
MVSIPVIAKCRIGHFVEAEIDARLDGTPARLPAFFIRAPRMSRLGPGVTTLAHWRGEPVLAREGAVLVGTFHPKLTDD